MSTGAGERRERTQRGILNCLLEGWGSALGREPTEWCRVLTFFLSAVWLVINPRWSCEAHRTIRAVVWDDAYNAQLNCTGWQGEGFLQLHRPKLLPSSSENDQTRQDVPLYNFRCCYQQIPVSQSCLQYPMWTLFYLFIYHLNFFFQDLIFFLDHQLLPHQCPSQDFFLWWSCSASICL